MTSKTAKNKDRVSSLLANNHRIIVMGVVNTTPDSFSDGGQFVDPQAAFERALRLAADGADIIDIGGESTRPGAEPVSLQEELRRVVPLIERLSADTDTLVSIDTYKEPVARAALQAGAAIVNDVTALHGDAAMAATVAEFGAGLILMHLRGEPRTMQTDTHYDDLIGEIATYLRRSVTVAEHAGVDPRRIIIDPGIGFGKDLAGNLEIIKSIERFAAIGKPVLIGASRKSFIGRITGTDPADRLYGSVAAATAAVINGAAAVRVHDVRETRQAVDIAIQLRRV